MIDTLHRAGDLEWPGHRSLALEDTPDPDLMWMLLGLPLPTRINDDAKCRAPIVGPSSFWSGRTLYARATDQLIPAAPVFTDPGIDGLNASVICPHGLADCPESHAIFRAIPPSRWPRYDV